MIIVAPISQHDADKLSKWTDVIIRYGNLANHSICLLPTYTVTQEAIEAAQRLIDVGIQTEVLKMQIEPYGGWPMASNSHFFEAVRLMAQKNGPWFWMEMDCLPDHSRWADVMGSRYSSCGAKFMGNVVETPFRNNETGKIVKTPDGDNMMIGCSVYPHDMAMMPEFQPLLMDFMKGPDSAPEAFDIYLRGIIRLAGRADVKLVDDKWNTERFEFDGEILRGYGRKAHEGMGDLDMRDRGGEVNPDAVLVHGCKDDSLYDLIMGGLDMANVFRKPAPIPQSTEGASFGAVFNPSPSDQRVQKLENELAEMKEMLKAALKKDQPGGAGASPAEFAGSRSVKEHPESPGAEEQKPALKTIDKLVELITNSEKKIRLDQASEKLNIPINKLKAIIESANSPVRKGKLGWLSLSEVNT